MNTERVPPHDLDAEAAVLSAALLERASLDIALVMLKPEYFYAEANRQIFRAAVALSADGRPVDIVTVAGVLRETNRLQQIGGGAYLTQIVDACPAVAHVETYANTVRAKWRVREVIATCQRLAAEGYGAGDAQVFVDQAQQALFDIGQRDEKRDAVSFETVLREAHVHMLNAEARGSGSVELPTGLHALDRKIGGLGRGRVTVIAARPGMGKTALATGIVEAIAVSVGPAVIYSLEMPRMQLGMRMACARAGASVHRAFAGRLADVERAEVMRAKDRLRKLPIWIDDTPAISLMRLRSKARAIAAHVGRPLALVAIDYLQLMKAEAHGDTRDRELSEITAGLKELSKDLDCAVLLLSQLNRKCEDEKDKRPHLRHLRESGGIEQDADDVIFVYRDEYYNPKSEDKGKAELIVAKQRNGPTGTVKVAFFGRSTTFENLGNDDTPQPEDEE